MKKASIRRRWNNRYMRYIMCGTMYASEPLRSYRGSRRAYSWRKVRNRPWGRVMACFDRYRQFAPYDLPF